MRDFCMGYFYAPDEIMDKIAQTLKPTSTLVLLFLIRAANNKRESYYGHAKMGKLLNMGRRSVVRAVAELKDRSLITVIGNGMNGTSCRYRVCQIGTGVRQKGTGYPRQFGVLRTTQVEVKQNKEVNAYGFIPDP